MATNMNDIEYRVVKQLLGVRLAGLMHLNRFTPADCDLLADYLVQHPEIDRDTIHRQQLFSIMWQLEGGEGEHPKSSWR